MLAYGAMAGVGGEYIAQSKEKRENDFTLLRDKRLSEMKKTEATHSSKLVGGREKDAREHGDKNYTAALTSNVYRDGKKVQTGSHRPNAGTALKPDEHTIYRGNNQPTSYEQLYDEWYGMAHAKNEYGEEIRNADIPGWEDWVNTQVQEKYRINPKPPGSDKPDAGQSTDAMEQARKEYNEKSEYFSSDKTQFGMSEDEWVNKRASEIMQGGSRGGMLTEDAEVPAPEPGDNEGWNKSQPLKSPLSQAAKTDPVQMYDELNRQGFGDQDIEDTIRQFFKDPTWTIPPNSTM